MEGESVLTLCRSLGVRRLRDSRSRNPRIPSSRLSASRRPLPLAARAPLARLAHSYVRFAAIRPGTSLPIASARDYAAEFASATGDHCFARTRESHGRYPPGSPLPSRSVSIHFPVKRNASLPFPFHPPSRAGSFRRERTKGFGFWPGGRVIIIGDLGVRASAPGKVAIRTVLSD